LAVGLGAKKKRSKKKGAGGGGGRASGGRGVGFNAATAAAPSVAAASPAPAPAAAAPETPPPAESPTPTELLFEAVERAVEGSADSIVAQLTSRGWFKIDDFLAEAGAAPGLIREMRAEAAALEGEGQYVTSQSTRWSDELGRLEHYDKHNVKAMQLVGGEAQYKIAPRLIEYTVAMTRCLPPVINARFDSARLSSTVQTNKLACCLGEGSSYDKHIDNQGGDDLRKLTVLLYCNPGWREELGGSFRIFPSSDVNQHEDVEPLGDRLFGFWSDQLVHSVQPSFAPGGRDDWRYALTIWFCAEDAGAITSDQAMLEAHWPQFNGGNTGQG